MGAISEQETITGAGDRGNAATTICVARQPILDRDQALFGYELLFRELGDQEAVFSSGNIATARVLTHTLIDIGLERMVGRHAAFINMSEDFLNGHLTVPMNPAQSVLEIQEDVEPSAEVINGINALRDAGFRICLSHSRENINLNELLQQADMVKIDIASFAPEHISSEVQAIRERGAVILIAGRVESRDAEQQCRKLGFDYFQGFYFAQPEIVEGTQIPSNELTLLQLMSKSWQPEVELGEIEDLITQDVSLSYKLLRFINSAAFVTRREIDTIHGAVVILGIRNLARWISMLTVSSLESSGAALTELAMIRARMCELIALARGEKEQAPIYFTAGLLSILDALLGVSMDDALSQLPLSDELNGALRDHSGPVGALLKDVIAYERGGHDIAIPAQSGLFGEAYLESVTWAREMQASLNSA